MSEFKSSMQKAPKEITTHFELSEEEVDLLIRVLDHYLTVEPDDIAPVYFAEDLRRRVQEEFQRAKSR